MRLRLVLHFGPFSTALHDRRMRYSTEERLLYFGIGLRMSAPACLARRQVFGARTRSSDGRGPN